MWQDVIKSHYKHKIDKDEIILKICPYCDNSKFNFQISSTKEVYNCWVCAASGKIEKFFRDQNLEFDKTGWKSSATFVERPKELLNFDGFHPVEYNLHAKFLLSRGIAPDDVAKYSLMTTSHGRYKDKLIIPLKEGSDIVYFVSRGMFAKGKYCNPVINKREHLFYYLGTNHKTRLYIVEGAFDAISVNKLGFSVAILLGSSISKEQIAKIKRIGFTEVVVCLDGDLKKKAIQMYDTLRTAEIHAKILLIPGKEDPNDLYTIDKEYLKKLLNSPREVTVMDKAEMALCR